MEPLTKICKSCKQEKPLEDFGESKKYQYNRHYDCRVCQKAKNRQWYENNLEKAKAKSAERYSKVRVAKAEERKKKEESLLAEEMVRTTKFCSACQQDKPKTDFSPSKTHKYGLHCWCNPCKKQKHNEWCVKNKKTLKKKRAEKYALDKEVVKEKRKQYHELNKEEINKRRREQYFSNLEKRQEILEQNREYRKKNKNKLRDKDREKERRKLKTDPKFKVDLRMGSAIWGDLKFRKTSKKGKSWQMLAGYTKDDLMAHLQSKFKEGVTWDNYGSYWHIDHIVPKSWFKYTSAEDPEFRRCWSLENLQPLEAKLNIGKGNLYAGTPDNPITKEELYGSN
jgi:hypothetical protein